MKVAIQSIALEKTDQGRRHYRVVISGHGISKAYKFIVPGEHSNWMEWENDFARDFLLVGMSIGEKIMNTVWESDEGKTFSFPMEIASQPA